eukprot:Phypoly_transcript_12099.p1 GENE.Phypoly_transcript_12099~~Phypoly_transcript_12099.p1  ORF type:complete len:355 (+),score=86.80 Phypoly_transcript_12099:89-1066(+)
MEATKDNGRGKKHKLDHRDNKQSKKQKRHFPPFKNWKKHTKLFSSTEIIRGVVLTGQHNREGNMIGEILETFRFFVDLFYPQLSGLSHIPAEVPDESNQEAETTAQAEETKKQKLFEVINSGCSGMAIISFVPKELDPVEFTRRMLEHIIEKREPRPKFSVEFTNRVVPLEATCEISPSLERLLEVAKPVIDSHFKDKPACKFAIRVEHRNCNTFDRMKCINALAPLVGPEHKVDLENPDLVIMVQVFKSAAGVAVLPDYNKLRKYNIIETYKAGKDDKKEKGKQEEKGETKEETKEAKEAKEETKEEAKEETSTTTATQEKEEK